MDPAYRDISAMVNRAATEYLRANDLKHLKPRNKNPPKGKQFPDIKARVSFHFRPPFVGGNGRNYRVGRDELALFYHAELSGDTLNIGNLQHRVVQNMFSESEYQLFNTLLTVNQFDIERTIVEGRLTDIPKYVLPCVNAIVACKREPQ